MLLPTELSQQQLWGQLLTEQGGWAKVQGQARLPGDTNDQFIGRDGNSAQNCLENHNMDYGTIQGHR